MQDFRTLDQRMAQQPQAYTPADTDEVELPYNLLDAVEPYRIWAPKFKGAIFDLYWIASSEMDIVATARATKEHITGTPSAFAYPVRHTHRSRGWRRHTADRVYDTCCLK